MLEALRVALIGAGNIADTHADVLRAIPRARVTAIVDPHAERANAMAARFSDAQPFTSVDELLHSGKPDVAHVLVPPGLHARLAEPLLHAGVHVLAEKPLAQDADACARLASAARAGRSHLAVNHNFTHHPALTRLRADVRRGRIGPVEHVQAQYAMPLRQLAAGQLGHWMFACPRNLLLEQAVHPLSQLDALLGPFGHVQASPGPAREVADGISLVTEWLISLSGASGTAQLRVALGVSHPVWRLSAIGSDGTLEADMLANTARRSVPTGWIEAGDTLSVGVSTAAGDLAATFGNGGRYAASMVGLGGRSDAFFISMRASIAAFYDRLDPKQPRVEPDGARLVDLCCEIADQTPALPPQPRVHLANGRARDSDIVLLGGTGFIGRHMVAQLVEQGQRVTVMARGTSGLPKVFGADHVEVLSGSITDRASVADALARAPKVVHLAHGGGKTWADIERAMVHSCDGVADAALAAGTEHLVFVSTIAALYLGDAADRVTSRTGPDPEADTRADYARGKAMAEQIMRQRHERDGLPLSIVRPGVVLGRGTSPFHSGIGLFNRETHCLGWNAGRNALPLVLVDDVAAALITLALHRQAAGENYHLVGDVRPNARGYIAELGARLRRPLRYHPQRVHWLYGVEVGKWGVKRLGGRRDAACTSLRDLKSRGLVTPFDTSDDKQRLDWQPEADPERFYVRAFAH